MILNVPVPGSLKPYQVDMSKYVVVERALEEIETLNLARSNYLLANLFSISFDISTHMDKVSRLASKAKQLVAQRKAVITIDLMPAKLSEKKLTSNDTNRQAIIDMDVEYQSLVEQYNEISATEELLKLRCHKYEDAIRTVRSIAYNLVAVSVRQNPNLNAALGQIENEPVGVSSEEIKQIKFGKSKYGT